MSVKAGSSSIKIPSFSSPANIDLSNAGDPFASPDAPMSETPKSKTAAPAPSAPPAGTDDFLKSVREMNEAKIPEEEREKKKVSDQAPPDSQDDSDNQDDGEVADDFVDPADAPPAKKTKAESFKEVRQQLSSTRGRLTVLETQLAEQKAENERLLSLQEKATKVEELEQRVKELEPYEQIVDIHNNPNFHNKYIRGAQQLTEQAKQLAKEYKADPAIIDQALGIKNRADLSSFLDQHIKNRYGVDEIRPYILNLQALDAERLQLEKSPAEAREVLSSMHRENEERRVGEVTKQIKDRGDNAWNQITSYYSKGENAIDLLKDKPADAEHTTLRNEVLGRANVEYQKVLGALVGLGTKEIPVAIAQTLSARYVLAELAGEINAKNKVLAQQVKDLKKQLQDADSHSRPAFNGANGSGNFSGDSAAPETTNGRIEAAFLSAQGKIAAQNSPR